MLRNVFQECKISFWGDLLSIFRIGENKMNFWVKSTQKVSKNYPKTIQKLSKKYPKSIQKVSKKYPKSIQKVPKKDEKLLMLSREKEKCHQKTSFTSF